MAVSPTAEFAISRNARREVAEEIAKATSGLAVDETVI